MRAQDDTEPFVFEVKRDAKNISDFAAVKNFLILRNYLDGAYAKNSLPAIIVAIHPVVAVHLAKKYREVAVRPAYIDGVLSGKVPVALLGSGN